MIIKVPVTHYENINLDQKQVNDITLRNLYKLLNWGSEYFIRDNKVWETREYTTSHHFEMDEVVRDATEEDIATETLINTIVKKMKES